MDEIEKWCEEEMGGEWRQSAPDEAECSISVGEEIRIRGDTVIVDRDEFESIDQWDEVSRDGEEIHFESDSASLRVSPDGQNIEVDRLIHVTDSQNVESICARGLRPRPRATTQDGSEYENMVEAVDKIDEHRPEGAPLRSQSVFLGVPAVSFNIDPEGITGEHERLHIDPEEIPESCQCVMNDNFMEAMVNRSLRDNSPRDPDEEAELFWESSVVGNISKLTKKIDSTNEPRGSPEIYCGCTIPPEAIDECQSA